MKMSKVLAPSPAALPAAERREDERSAAAGNGGPDFQPALAPNPEVVAKAKRRRFTAEY